ncbi:putative bifunctional diguanylate cyclase/phosphodiesterase [Derxia gummosa]|uniref:Bifunctional diguanylate cyclase/phosphodiesterase n=1 Tax=Derxia gummosa DSM 723 TaxID=1121388 RepID=A0A8B6XBI4_9BURK|nr:EAL domain-containing protein [Derxia gummosa]
MKPSPLRSTVAGAPHRLAESALLFPLLTLMVLGIIWVGVLRLTANEMAAADRAAALLARELSETCEAQVLGALHEIDQTLKLVKYAHETGSRLRELDSLEARALLPQDPRFTVSLIDRDGRVLAGTRDPSGAGRVDAAELRAARAIDAMVVGLPRPASDDPAAPGATLRFSRRLDAGDGSFDGIATVTVDAAYFTAGYDAARLGEHGVLALLGRDGVFRARRSGAVVTTGDRTDYAALRARLPDDGAALSTPWDGVRRHARMRELPGFPLAVIAGVADDEQFAAARAKRRTFVLRASAASAVVICVFGLLGRLSHALARSRRRAVEEHIAHARRVEYLAYHDSLTGLPNRSLFSKLLGQGIAEAREHERQLAVLFLDLDHFKQINDTLGHDAGDDLLKEVALRLRACLGEGDTVARLGGDEFVVLLPATASDARITDVAEAILTAVARPFMLIGQEFRISASVGAARYPLDGLDEQSLTKHADSAMYQAKEDGKNNFQFYSETRSANALQRLSLEASLRRALERDEFALHYQAKRDAVTGQLTGMEALLRWEHPDLGSIGPMQFLPVAEESGLIVPIGRWVLRTACAQGMAWQKQGLPALPVAINLTARQFFDPRLIGELSAALTVTGLAPELLELEVAESLLMNDVERSVGILTHLRLLGVRIAIDDFGVGYSSLSALRQFPIDSIKIDRSFMRDAGSVPEARALTEAIIGMGRTLSMSVVAQGIETEAQADYLRANGCNEFQGYYVSRPLAAGEFEQVLRGDLAGQGGGLAAPASSAVA